MWRNGVRPSVSLSRGSFAIAFSQSTCGKSVPHLVMKTRTSRVRARFCLFLREQGKTCGSL